MSNHLWDIFLGIFRLNSRLEQPVKPLVAGPDRAASRRLSLGGIIKQRQREPTVVLCPPERFHLLITSSEPLGIYISSSVPSPACEARFSTAAHRPERSLAGPIRYPTLCSHQHPLTTPLDELVQQQGQVLQDKPADVEGKELGSVPSTELEPDLRLVCVSEAWILHLASNLV